MPNIAAAIPLMLLLVMSRCPAAEPSDDQSPPEAPKVKPATIKVSGYGLIGNRVLKRALVRGELAGAKPEFFDAGFVEDCSLILLSRVRRDGYLQPTISLELRSSEGETIKTDVEQLLENPLPRSLRITAAHFHVEEGELYYYDAISFEGLTALKRQQGLAYFVETGLFLKLKGSRVFTPQRYRRSTQNLLEALRNKGYRDAEIDAGEPAMNESTGAVEVKLSVREGPRFIVRSVQEKFVTEDEGAPRQERLLHPWKPYSRLWQEDFSQLLKTNLYARGFPDASVDFNVRREDPTGAVRGMDLEAEIRSGHRVRVGQVIIQGARHTKPSFLSRRVRTERGEYLNPLRAERGRTRLAELGIFNSVGLDYRPVDEHTRDIIYRVNEGRRFTVSLLMGWGSYEMLRGGFEAELNNIWGLAHRARLKGVQSFRATSGDFTYTIPDFSHLDFDLFFNAFGLRREEVNFTREEFGGGFGVHKYFRPLATDVTLRYNYQVLNARSIIREVASEGLTNPAVGSIIADFKYDRRDNPLYPRTGHKFFLSAETASESLAGEANYQRVDLSGSWHHRLGSGRWISLGVSHGFAASSGDPANNLPFNKRFFPGGANSIRGYQDGEASPRNEQEQIVGAESYLLGTVELEQALTPKWSLVIFADALGIARRLDDYPLDESLYSIGGGLRWRTIIGPVRLEYGHNLNPRKKDPYGTLQFSLGYPF
jgi:outer membrane protein assembly complex protein YaeT